MMSRQAIHKLVGNVTEAHVKTAPVPANPQKSCQVPSGACGNVEIATTPVDAYTYPVEKFRGKSSRSWPIHSSDLLSLNQIEKRKNPSRSYLPEGFVISHLNPGSPAQR